LVTDEAGIGSLGPGLDPGDDALDAAPALSGIVELREAALGAVRGRRPETIGDILLQCRDMTGECGVGSQAEDPIHPVGAAPVEYLWTGIMAVSAQQDLDLGPQGADGADETAHKAADFLPTRPRAGPQHGRDETPFAVKHHDRLKTVIVMKGIEQPQLLAAVHAVEGVVDIEQDALGHLPK
jgi:hypothetical protein